MKLLVSFVAGALCSAIVMAFLIRYWLYPAIADDKFRYGHDMGVLDGQIDIGRQIPDVLGRDVDPHEPLTPFFSAKTLQPTPSPACFLPLS